MEFIDISDMVGKVEQLNVKNLLLLFYIIIPIVFYSIPLILFLINGNAPIHFYKTYYPNLKEILEVLIGHFILGVIIFVCINKNIIYTYKKTFDSIIYNLLAIIALLLFIFSKEISNIISIFSIGVIIILVANVRIYKITYFILLLLSFIELIIYKERYLTIFILMFMSLSFLSKRSLLELFLLSLIGIFFLVFILQDLRYGKMPFNTHLTFNLFLLDIYEHINPIYYTAYLANSIDFSFKSLVVEFIPFGKSLSGEMGIVEKLAQVGLPPYLIEEGTRLGSNSAMYFSLKGIFLLLVMCGIIFGTQKIIKSSLLINSIVIYFVVQGPYFIRRSFASFTIDIITIISIVILILMIKQTILFLRKKNAN